MTTIAVFGASGRTGRLIVDAALSRGIEVRVLVRPSASLDERPGLTVVRGSLGDPADVAAAITGSSAVGCVFGPRSASEAPFCADATGLVVAAMKARGVARLVCLTGAMVGELPENVSRPMRALARLYRRQVQRLAEDASEQERLAMDGDLDWTIVKPPRLTDGAPSGRVSAGPSLRVGLLSRIRRADLAAFILDEMTLPRHVRERVYVRG